MAQPHSRATRRRLHAVRPPQDLRRELPPPLHGRGARRRIQVKRPLSWKFMRSFWAIVTRFDRKQLAPVMALRNALGVAVALFTGILFHNPSAGVMAATGALDAAFSDGNDPYVHRGRRMFAASVFVALAVFTGRLCGHNHALTIALEACCAFMAGIL